MPFGSLEHRLAAWLDRSPRFKRRLKRAYYAANYALHRPRRAAEHRGRLVRIGDPHRASFFGYYDRSPENPSGTLIAYHETDHPASSPPTPGARVEIRVQPVGAEASQLVGTSAAWNWQLGARIIWLGDHALCYNDLDPASGSQVARIVDLVTGAERTLQRPVFDADAPSAFSLCFARLREMGTGYGYLGSGSRPDADLSAAGIFRLDLASGSCEEVLTPARAAELVPARRPDPATQYFNHLMISPDRRRFMVLHRWQTPAGKRDRLLVCTADGASVGVLADEGMVSHCCWDGDDAIIGWMRGPDGRDRWLRLEVDSGRSQPLGPGLDGRHGDGHPSVHAGRLLFDSYPDRSRLKSLLVHDLATGATQTIGRFLEPLAYHDEARCDLHPRYSRDGRAAYLDSVHENQRHLYRLEEIHG